MTLHNIKAVITKTPMLIILKWLYRNAIILIRNSLKLVIYIALGAPQGSVLGSMLFNIFFNGSFFFSLCAESYNLTDVNIILACWMT